MRRHPGTLLIFLVIWLIAILCLADELDERRRQLDSIRDELESKRAQHDSLGQREKTEAERLQEVEQQVALSGQLLLRLGREASRMQENIKSQRLKLEITALKRDQRQEILKRRLVHIYKAGQLPGWLELASSESPTATLVALRNMKAILEYDRRLIESFGQLSSELKAGLVKYQIDVGQLSKLRNEQQDELSRREKTLKIRKNLVNKLRKDKKEIVKSISKLEGDARQIAEILETLELEREQALVDTALPGLAKKRGDLVWPAQGKIMRGFGSVKDKRGIVLSNPGVDIQAGIGADVLAAATGAVAYVNWLRGYGQFVIIDHGQGYYTLYAHLSDVLVEPGERVSAGELIALAGDSGSLEGPKLHFEIRHKKEQLDPTEWLR
jgi:septal ring factor EnvC (AmiA/AmiB activator)